MLKITESERTDASRTLILEGKLLAPWVAELNRVYRESPVSPRNVRLDLSGLTFVDEAGVQCLGGLIREGVAIVACSGFVAELLSPSRR